MLCCLESPFTDSKSSYYSQVATTDEKLLPDDNKNKKKDSKSYPGLRRTPHNPLPISTDGLISVTVPPGVLPGQEIHVRRPDGTGLVEAVVPSGMTEGSVFYVQAPPTLANPQQQYHPPPVSNNASATLKGDFANCLNDINNTTIPLPNTTGNHHQPSTVPRPKAPPGQELVRVQVPPGMEPGTTILVAIPNEPGRHVQAQIPPHVNEFLVAYEPTKRTNGTTATTTFTRGGQNNNDDSAAALPIIGGIATGVAAVMAYEHYS